MKPKIAIEHLYKIYNEGKESEFTALKNITLSVGADEIIILKGVSGSGKSTLLSLMAAFSKPSRGTILIDGENISKLPDIFASKFRNKEIGFIFQSFNLIEGLSVSENVRIPLVLEPLEKKEIDQKVEKALQLANIAHKSQQNIADLSGGEKQRCAIARALVNNPSIIFADEPTANLDKENSLKFIEVLEKFKTLKKCVVVATHDSLFDDLPFVSQYINITDGELVL